MKNFVKYLLLLVIIIVTFNFAVIKLLSLTNENSYFNREWRSKFAAYPWARLILGLHFNGDATQDFLGPRFSKIVIEVDVFDKLKIPEGQLQRFAQKIRQITGKNTAYLFSDHKLTYQPAVKEKELKVLAKNRDYFLSSEQANLYVLLLSKNSDSPAELGATVGESSIVIYLDSLSEFADYVDLPVEDLFFATLLHEFGHQIGLEHNPTANCLMNSEAEQQRYFIDNSAPVITDFCANEKRQIQMIKDLYK